MKSREGKAVLKYIAYNVAKFFSIALSKSGTEMIPVLTYSDFAGASREKIRSDFIDTVKEEAEKEIEAEDRDLVIRAYEEHLDMLSGLKAKLNENPVSFINQFKRLMDSALSGEEALNGDFFINLGRSYGFEDAERVKFIKKYPGKIARYDLTENITSAFEAAASI